MPIEAIEGLVRSEPLNKNFSALADRLKNAKSSVDSYESLPTSGNEVGDYRLVTGGSRAGEMFWWDGRRWESLQMDTSQVKRGDEPLNALLDLMFTEIGKNSNGSFARFGSGLQLCWSIVHIPEVSYDSSGSIYRSADFFMWSYPRSFVSTPISYVDINITNCWASRSSADPLEELRFRIFSSTGGDDKDIFAHCFAVGRWR